MHKIIAAAALLAAVAACAPRQYAAVSPRQAPLPIPCNQGIFSGLAVAMNQGFCVPQPVAASPQPAVYTGPTFCSYGYGAISCQ